MHTDILRDCLARLYLPKLVSGFMYLDKYEHDIKKMSRFYIYFDLIFKRLSVPNICESFLFTYCIGRYFDKFRNFSWPFHWLIYTTYFICQYFPRIGQFYVIYFIGLFFKDAQEGKISISPLIPLLRCEELLQTLYLYAVFIDQIPWN